MRRDESQKPGGGFKFDDEQPQKQPKFSFSVQEVSEEEVARARATEKKQRAKPGTPEPEHGDADPGRFEWPMVGIVLVLLPLVYWLQQWTRGLHGETFDEAPAEIRQSEEVIDPGVDGLTVQSKLAVKLAFIYEKRGDRPANTTLNAQKEEFRKNRKDAWRRGPEPELPLPPQAQDEDPISIADLEGDAWTRVDRLRLAVVAGELDGPQAALARLQALKAETSAGSDLSGDILWLTQIYEQGPESIPNDAAYALRERHGWFGRLAMSFGKHASDSERWEVASGGEKIVITQVVVILAQILLSIGGLFVAAALVVKYRRTGYLVRYIPPDPGGSVFLETFGVFLGGFTLLLLTELIFFGAHAEGTVAASTTHEILLWTLVGTIAWPLVRGMRRPEFRKAIGLHTGQGLKAEVIAGLVGYLGAQPLVWFGSWVGSFVESATGTAEAETAGGWGMFEAPTQGTGIIFWLGILSAVIWAPVVEESIFRGSLFRHLSGRMNLMWSAVVTAALFGLIHPYTPAGLIEVGFSGIAFGLMRAWRGSLIAPMTAHALHNGVISLIPATLVGMLG